MLPPSTAAMLAAQQQLPPPSVPQMTFPAAAPAPAAALPVGQTAAAITGSAPLITDPRWRSLTNTVEWTPAEQSTLEDGLQKYSTEHTPLAKYVKIAAELALKNVRDVALRVQWMQRKDALSRKRKADGETTTTTTTTTTGAKSSKSKRGTNNNNATTTNNNNATTTNNNNNNVVSVPPPGAYLGSDGVARQPGMYGAPPFPAAAMSAPQAPYLSQQVFQFEEHGGPNLLENMQNAGMNPSQTASLRTISRMLEENATSFKQIRSRMAQMRAGEVGELLRGVSERLVGMIDHMSGVGMVPMPPLPVKLLNALA